MSMNSTSFSFYSSVFGFVVGGISLLSFIVAVCRPHLPGNKIKTLETLLHETENSFREAVEAGLLIHDFIERTEERLTGLKGRTCSLRARAYNATTIWKDYAEFFSGTSTAIGRTCQSVKNLRAEVITSSEERRHRLLQMDSALDTPPRTVPPNPEIDYTQAPTPPAEIPRPFSCPPALPAWKSDPMQNILLESDPFGDPSQGIEMYGQLIVESEHNLSIQQSISSLTA